MIIHNPIVSGSLRFPSDENGNLISLKMVNGKLDTITLNSSGVDQNIQPAVNFSGSFSGSFIGDGSSLTGVSATDFNIDALDALGGASIDQADNFLLSDGGTEKKVTFSNLEDTIFSNVSGDISIAAGGSTTLGNAYINTSLNAYTASNDTTNSLQNTRLNQLSQETGSYLTTVDISSNTNLAVSDTTNVDMILSGDTLSANLKGGVVSGSAQIDGSGISNNSITIAGNSVSLNGSIALSTIIDGNGIVSGSSQLTSDFDSRYLNTNGDSVVSGSAQIDGSQLGSNNSISIVGNDITLGGSISLAQITNGSGIVSGSSQISLTGFDTDDLSEGSSNQYFTNARARAAISATGDISYDSGTGIISFTNDAGDIEGVTAGAGLVGGGTSGTVTLAVAGGVISGSSQVSHDSTTGFVANEHIDHSSVSITAGTGLNGGGDITTTRTINVDSDYKNDSLNTFTSSLDADLATFSVPASTTISSFGKTLVDDADASAARTTLGVDAAGTDNSTDVTLSGTPDYITISGQVITRNTIDIGDDTNLTAGTGITLTGDTLSTTDSEIVHDNLSGFVANEHIDHSSITIGSGKGLSGGGNITVSRSLTLDTGSNHFQNAVSSRLTSLNTFSASLSTNLADLTDDEVAQLENIGSTTISSTQWGYLGALNQGLTTTSDVTFSSASLSDVTISGNLVVQGTTTEVNSNTVNIGDNIIVLNSDESGTPSQDGGIEIERGTSTNVRFQFKESTDRWQFTNDGSTYFNLPTSTADVAEYSNLYYTDARVKTKLNVETVISGSSQVNHDSTTGFVSNEHINHTSVSITAGAGLTGGGDISSTRTINVGAGTGVTVNANDIAIGQAVGTGDDVTFGTVRVDDATASTSKTTGALIVDGGAGISGDLNVGGDVVAYASSDERLKDNIELISNPIEKVQSLKGVTWNWNDDASETQKSTPNIGVIAQDVEKVLPQLVHDRDNGFKGVDYAKLTGLLIEAIKDQQKQIDELKSKLS